LTKLSTLSTSCSTPKHVSGNLFTHPRLPIKPLQQLQNSLAGFSSSLAALL